MNKLLVICGPTATGKTSLALSLAKKFDGELISADSRQVYKGMDIGTGKDIPQGFEFRISDLEFRKKSIGFYTDGLVRIWGYDLVEPGEEFSVAHYVRIASKIINDIWERGKLPILVGGTGFYIKGLVDGIDTVSVPKNESLRESLKDKSVAELQNILKKVGPEKYNSFNESDVKNPRRLIRSIEVVKSAINVRSDLTKPIIAANKNNLLYVGLTAPRDLLNERIQQRVDKRVQEGIEKEIAGILKEGVGWDSQAMQSLGYGQWLNYYEIYSSSGYEKGITEDTELAEDAEKSNIEGAEKEIAEVTEQTESTERRKAIENWTRAEKQYAKRQMTWFKKDKRIKWFDISRESWKGVVENTVRKWHNGR